MPNGFGFNPTFSGNMACPTCGYTSAGVPTMGAMCAPGMAGPMMGYPYGAAPMMGPWFAGPATWGGPVPGMWTAPGWTYPGGMPNDDEIRQMVYDSLDADPAIPYDSDINVDVAGGIVTLSGTAPSKRVKHAAGDDAWWVPGVGDVNNNLRIVGRRERAAARPAQAATTGKTRQDKTAV